MTGEPGRGAGAVERLANAVLRLDPEWSVCLEPLLGKVVDVRVEPEGPGLRVQFTADGLRVLADDGSTADVSIRGTMPVLLAAASGEGLPNGLHVTGNVALLEVLRRQLARLDLDWEELLARRLGDVAGRQAARALRGGVEWSARAGDTLARDLVEYLGEEAGLLTTGWPIEQFCEDVDRLRDDVDRLEQRVARLAPAEKGRGG